MKLVGRSSAQLFLLAWSLLAVIPFILVVLLSLRNNEDIYAHPLGVGGTYHLSNYGVAWSGPSSGSDGMAVFFRNTMTAAAVALGVNLAAGSLAAYFVTRLSRRMQTWYLRLFLVGTVVPFVLVIVPYYRIYSTLGLLENPAAIGVAYGALALPPTVLVLYSHFVDFPKVLIEAGKVDGLNELRIYWQIVMPLSKGALTTVAVLLVVFVWNEAQLGIVLLQSSSAQTVAVGLLGFQGANTVALGPIFAGLTLASAPVIIFYLIFSKAITRGIALGGFLR